MQLAPAFVTEPCPSEAFSVRFSPDGHFLAAATALGKVSVYNVSTGQEAYRLNRGGTHPMKQVCWRPEAPGAPLRTRGILVGASTDGKLRQWHVTSCRCLQEWADPAETGQLFCVDYSADGQRIVAGGLRDLWVYDEETKKQVVHLQGGDSRTTAGHSSRVMAVRFHPADPSFACSGGWDNSVQFWDLRLGHAVRAIYGPHICGDAVDVTGDGRTVLTGSWREQEPLELWDFGSGRRLEVVPWRVNGIAEPACFLYTARFAQTAGGSLIAAGGSCSASSSGATGGEAKILERRGAGWRCAATLVNFKCLSVDFGGVPASTVAMGGSDGRVRVMGLGVPAPKPEAEAMDGAAARPPELEG